MLLDGGSGRRACRAARIVGAPPAILGAVILALVAGPATAHPTAPAKPGATPAAAAAHATPAPGAGSSSAAPSPPRSLPISITLGPVQVGVNLPLDLGALLGDKRSTPTPTPTPTTPAPSTTAPDQPPSSRAYPPTMPSTADARPSRPQAMATPTPTANAASTQRAVQQHHRPSGTATEPATRTGTKDDNGVLFVKRLVPTSAPVLVIVLCGLCALGVAVVVQLSGGRRRL